MNTPEENRQHRISLQRIRPESAFYRDRDWQDGYLQDPDSAFPLIRFHSFDSLDWLSAACTTRYGGVSTGYLAELNLGWSRGDAPGNVQRNYRRAAERIGGEYRNLALSDQVHETTVLEAVPELTLGEEGTRKIRRVDGLATSVPGVILSATFADCVPLMIADPVRHRIANVHSGWRGTAERIGEKAVERLAAGGSRPEDLTAVIGPCISGPHYEVTGDVIEALSASFSAEAMRDIALRTDELHWLCDLPAACWHTLREAGIPGDRIHLSGFCTWENAGHLFSHRKTGGKRGNFNTFMMIR